MSKSLLERKWPSDAPTAAARRFKAFLHVAKSYEDAAGQWWMEGIASGPQLDAHGERMSEACVESFGKQINSGQVRLLSSHWVDWEGELGFLREGTLTRDGELMVRVWLDKEHPDTRKLWRKLNGVPEQGIAPSKLGMSIGGWLVDAHSEVIEGQYVFTIDELTLDHVAVTSSPAYPNAWIEDVEVKTREFARPWLLDIVKSSKLDRTRSLKTDDRGGNMDPDALKDETANDGEPETPPSDATKESEEAPALKSEDIAAAFDALKTQLDESLAAFKSAIPAVRLVRANDILGDEMVLVRDEEADPADDEEDDEDEDEDLEELEDDEDDDEEEDTKSSAKSERSRPMLTKSQRLLAKLKEERAARKAVEAKLAKATGQRPEGERRGLRNQDGDDKARQDRQAKPDATVTEKGNWVQQLKATDAYKRATPHERVAMLQEGLDGVLKTKPQPAAR